MSYTQIFIHAVIRTHKNERTLPTDERREFLYRYVWGIMKNKKGYLYRINSVEEHVHLLFTLPPTVAVADFMRELKAETSKALKTADGFERFKAWSEGYAALTYSLRDKDMLVKYIINQQEHHKKVSFFDEFRALIKEMGLELDERDWEK